jgi:hypothetical protein
MCRRELLQVVRAVGWACQPGRATRAHLSAPLHQALDDCGQRCHGGAGLGQRGDAALLGPLHCGEADVVLLQGRRGRTAAVGGSWWQWRWQLVAVAVAVGGSGGGAGHCLDIGKQGGACARLVQQGLCNGSVTVIVQGTGSTAQAGRAQAAQHRQHSTAQAAPGRQLQAGSSPRQRGLPG